jgi:hypothetical protein
LILIVVGLFFTVGTTFSGIKEDATLYGDRMALAEMRRETHDGCQGIAKYPDDGHGHGSQNGGLYLPGGYQNVRRHSGSPPRGHDQQVADG